MKNLAHLFIFVIALCMLTAANAEKVPDYLTDYHSLLTKYLSQGEKQGIKTTLVDYVAWGRDPLHKEALSNLQQIDPAKLSGADAKMAFWLNAYNLFTIDLIIKTGEMASIKNQGSLFKNVWKSFAWEIHGERYTLDQIEHEILRPMGDPRIHMAINCASLSCPDLRAEPYIVEKLAAQLEEQTVLFIENSAKGVAIVANELQVSAIFKWFAEDFGDNDEILEFIRKRLPETQRSAKMGDYLDYNWSLNIK